MFQRSSQSFEIRQSLAVKRQANWVQRQSIRAAFGIAIGAAAVGLFALTSMFEFRYATADEPAPGRKPVGATVQVTEAVAAPVATISGTEPGWRELSQDDFENVNLDADTWSWGDGMARCTGSPVGVIRSKKQFTNFEMVAEWRHNSYAGNSGIFVWSPAKSLDGLARNSLPHGIEVQVLDLGYTEQYETATKKKADWFTCHGDVFPVGSSEMTPFPPVAPDGRRSFPTQNLSRGMGEWNHYYIRAINGEVRLWVNGVEVSGGTKCSPATGHLALESEGAPVDFRNLRIRELP